MPDERRDPLPAFDVRIAIFVTIEQANLIIEALTRLQDRGEADPVIDELMRQIQPYAGSIWAP